MVEHCSERAFGMPASITQLPGAARGPQAATPPRATRPPVGSKPARVAELIREMIIEDRLPPGAPIRERTLALQLQVSRTPLREALKLLSAEGLVELQIRRGATVAAPSDREVRELLELLGVIEAHAGELAARNATAEELRELRALHLEMLAAYTRGDRLGYFHRNQNIHLAILQATRNQVLIEHHRRLNARVYRARYVCNLRTQRWESAIREHEAILEALERRDGAAAAAILKDHVIKAWDKMQEILASGPAIDEAGPRQVS
jgi:DNA-binding GntR family transcriptional regulator